jgi:hypothetical protein
MRKRTHPRPPKDAAPRTAGVLPRQAGKAGASRPRPRRRGPVAPPAEARATPTPRDEWPNSLPSLRALVRAVFAVMRAGLHTRRHPPARPGGARS